MKERLKSIFCDTYMIILCISIFVSGNLLIMGCLYIYQSENGYSAEIVADIFSKIQIPIYITLLLIIGNFVLGLFTDKTEKKQTQKDYNQIFKFLSNSRDTTDIDPIFLKLESMKKLFKIINYGVITVSGIVFLLYALNGKNFHTSDINESMIRAMKVLLPCATVSFVFAIITHFYTTKCIKKQIALLKDLPSKTKEPTVKKNHSSKLHYIKIAIIIVAVVLIIYGAAAGGFADVLTKAVNICTECIGLG